MKLSKKYIKNLSKYTALIILFNITIITSLLTYKKLAVISSSTNQYEIKENVESTNNNYIIENNENDSAQILTLASKTSPTEAPKYMREDISTLDDITINGESINKFSPNKLNYKIFLESATVTVAVKKTNENQTVSGIGTLTLPAKGNLNDQFFEIVVVSADGTHTSTYKIYYQFATTIISTDNFGYTGAAQEYIIPKSGYYKTQLWGAAGGNANGGAGGKGAYTEGKIYLDAGTKIYIYVGEYYNGWKSTKSFNGGGSGCYSTKENSPNANGGGATDIRFVQGSTWDEFSSLKSRIMVAAGGAGGASWTGITIQGGYGGALVGGSGNYYRITNNWITVSTGGTQTEGGLGSAQNQAAIRGTIRQGIFGAGGYSTPFAGQWVYSSGGGGGYYGGGAGGSDSMVVSTGSGGSSYISGYQGCNSIDRDSTEDNIIHTGDKIHYTGKYFINGVMYAGNQNFANKSGSGTATGNSGAGYATIKLLDEVSNNKTISNIITDKGTIVEAISPNRDTYTIRLAPDEYKVNLTVQTTDVFSIVNSEELENLIIPAGRSTRTFTVTAEDGTTKVYTINFERTPSNVNYIDGITVNGRYYKFDKNKFEYNIELPYNEEYADITAEWLLPSQTIIGIGKYDIENDARTITMQVIAEDGVTTGNYTLNFTNEHCNYLKNIRLTGISFSEEFNPEKFNYRIALTSRYTELEFNTEIWDPEATVTIQGNTGLELGENTVTIKVHEPNIAVDTTYTIIVQITNQIKYEYDYTGNYQSFVAPLSGYYDMKLWGASGGNQGGQGGKGAYTEGRIYLEAGTVLYIYVGENYNGYKNVMSFNGGGKGNYSTTGDSYNANGGGATDIRLVKGENWSDFDSLKSRIMVAAGGGGAATWYRTLQGGYGGTLVGGYGNYNRSDWLGSLIIAEGGTQTNGGLPASSNPEALRNTTWKGAFGIGGYNQTYSSAYIYNPGGGGGYYGGGSGGAGTHIVGSGAGGSSFISGYTGCDAIAEESTTDNIIHTGQSIHYSGYKFINGLMYAGNETIPSKTLQGTTTGNTGNGYALIEYIEPKLNYEEKEIVLQVDETYEIELNKLSIIGNDDLTVGNLLFESSNSEIVSINGLGLVTGIKEGKAKIKITDDTNNLITYIYVTVCKGAKLDIGAGNNFTIALKQNGTVWSFGLNNKGQLGNSNNTNSNEPIKVVGLNGTEQLQNIKQISVGGAHTLALDNDGKVYSWGENTFGKLGDGQTENRNVPYQIIELTNIVKIEAYKNTSMAIDIDGNLYAWGEGYTNTPTKIETELKMADVSGNIVLTKTGEVYYISDLNNPIKGLSGISKISCGKDHYLALSTDGIVSSWGNNSHGELGGIIKPGETLVEVMANIFDISAGNDCSIIRTNSGEVYTFGNSANGQISLGATLKSTTPTKIEGIDIILTVNAGEGTHSCLVDEDGFVWNSGSNVYGELGTGNYVSKNLYSKIGETKIITNPDHITVVKGDVSELLITTCHEFNLRTDIANDTISDIVSTNPNIADLNNIVNVDNSNIQNINNMQPNFVVSGNKEGRSVITVTDSSGNKKNIWINVIKDQDAISASKLQNGDGYTVSLKSNGEVHTWGKNTSGQLGLGDKINRNTPGKVALDNMQIEDISVGLNHTLILTTEGKVLSFGINSSGQLGTGNVTTYQAPIQISTLKNIKKVIAKQNTSFAIDDKGKVYAWGENYTRTPQLLNIENNVIDIGKTYYLSDDGIVRKIANNVELNLSYNENKQSHNEELVTERIVQISEGYDHITLLGESGTVYSYGQNTYGQLGDNTTIPRTSNVTTAVLNENEERISNIVEISSGKQYTVAVDNTGIVYTWGKNEFGELGENENVSLGGIQECLYAMPNTNLSSIINISAGTTHTAVSDEEGKVYTFGKGDNGELGNGENSNYYIPQFVGKNIVEANQYNILMEVGEIVNLQTWIDYFNLYKDVQFNIELEALDSSQLMIDNSTGEILALKSGRTTIIAKELGTEKIAVIQVRILEDGTTPSSNTVKIEPKTVTGGSHTLNLKVDGTVWSYGQNTYGQLGNGTNNYSDEPVQVKFPVGTIITKISAGEEHNLALDSNGNVWVWGRNQYYQLGNSNGNNINTPIKISELNNIKNIECGTYNSFAVTKEGEVYAWGLNANGECGIGSYSNKITITKVKYLINIIDIRAGKNGTIALKSTGEVYLTGSNLYGELGNGDASIRKQNTFKKLDSLNKIIEIGAGTSNNMALDVNGDLYAWGSNIYGELGLGQTASSISIPTKVENITNIRYLEGGKNTSCLINNNNEVYVAGLNKLGSLGNSTTTDINTFEKLNTISNIIDISQGNTYTTYIKQDGTVWASGDYNHSDESKKSKTKGNVPIQVGNNKTSFADDEILLNIEGTKNIASEIAYEYNLIQLNSNFKDQLNYQSLNTNIATVSNDGTVTGISTGRTWIKAISTIDSQEYIVRVDVVGKGYTASPKVAAGKNFAGILKGDGSIWSFGYNSNGELGDGTNITKDIPGPTNIISTYKNIEAGENFVIALRSDKTVWATGKNNSGQLGNGSTKSENKLYQVYNLEGISKIAVGKNHVIVLDEYGLLYGWGSNSNGQLGNDNVGANIVLPKIVNCINERIANISAGDNQSIVITATGKVYGMGNILNGFLPDIENAIKAEVGNGYILILTANNEIYNYDGNNVSKISGITDAIDMDVTGNVNIYQSIDRKTYTWGENTFGQLGNNSTSNIVSPTKVQEHSDNTYSIGAGYNNTYIIEDNGFVYASGLNEFGSIGNSTRQDSLIHTLVGNRAFKITPETKIMTVNDKEKPTIESDTFNVFENTNKDVSAYDWVSDDTDIVSVTDGELVAKQEGTAHITITDKVTGETVTIERFVVPINQQRIDFIKVNNTEAQASGYDILEPTIMTYSVKVETEANKGILVIKTNDSSDTISLDENNWDTNIGQGTLAINVDLPSKFTKIPIYIKISNGTVLKYILNVEKISQDVGIKKITLTTGSDVLNPTSIIEAIPVSVTRYEVVLPEDTSLTLADVIANSNFAYVSIDGKAYTQNEQTENIVIGSELTKEVQIVVKAENGTEQQYKLVIYKESELAELEKLTVNDKDVVKISEGKYSVILDSDVKQGIVYAKANSSLVEISIDNNTYRVNENTNTIELQNNPQEVTIKLKLQNGDIKEYTLEIHLRADETEDPPGEPPEDPPGDTSNLLDMVIVNGNIVTKNKSGIYEIYLPSAEMTATVRAIAEDSQSTVKISTFASETGESEVIVDTSNTTNTYTIEVTSKGGRIKQYTLVIKKAEQDTSLDEIYVQKDGFIKQATKKDETTYEVRVPGKYTDLDITAITGYVNSKVSIDSDSEYTKNRATKNITLNTTSDLTTVLIKVKSENEENEITYTLNIIKMSNDTNLLKVLVDDIEATYDTDTGEYTINLTEAKTNVIVKAIATSLTSKVKINFNEYEVNETTRSVGIDAKQTKATIIVMAEDGTTKSYVLNIEGLPDNTNILTVVVNGETATYKDGENIYEVRLDANTYNIEVTLEDLLAKLKLGDEDEKTGTSTTTITKVEGQTETKVEVLVTSQNGLEHEKYTIIIKGKSSNNNIDTITVNGIKAITDTSGNYKAYLKHTDTNIKVVATAEDDYAKTYIDGATNNTKVMSVTTELIDGKTIYNYEIIVISEDGNSNTYNLQVECLEYNTKVLKVNVSEDNNIFNQATLLEDGTYYYKVNRVNSVFVGVELESLLSTAAINGRSASLPVEITLTSETTRVTIAVTSQDGTIDNYILNIQKKSNDTKLKDITGSAIISKQINETNAYVYVDEDELSFDLDFILNDENASIKLGEDATYQKSHIQKSYNVSSLPDRVVFVELNILSENGDEKTFIVYVSRKSNTKVGSVTVNSDPVPYDEANERYYKVVDFGNSPSVQITADNSRQTVELLTEDGTLIKSGTGSISIDSLTLSTTDLSTKFIIRITSHNGEAVGQETYNLIIRQKSQDTKILSVKANNNEAKLDETGTIYSVRVSGKDNYPIEIVLNNENAKVKVEDDSGNVLIDYMTGVLTGYVYVPDDQTREFKICVVSENGETQDYTLKITRLNSNTNISSITVEDYDVDGITKIDKTVNIYNANTKTYSIIVNKNLSSSNVVVTLASGLSNVSLDDEEESEGSASINKTLNGLGTTTVKIKVRAADGKTEIRYLNIIQLSNELELEIVKVDGIEIIPDEAKNYEITVTDEFDISQIYAKAKSTAAKVSINSQPDQTAESTRNVSKGNSRGMAIPIKVTAEDGTSYIYTLILNIISHDTTTQYVKVDDDLTNYIDLEYKYFINADQTSTKVEIKTGSTYSKLKIKLPDGITTNGNIIETETLEDGSIINTIENAENLTFTYDTSDLTINDFYINYTVIAEDGTEKEYTIHLSRKSTLNDIEELYVNGTKITPDSEGNYYATVTDGDLNAMLEVIANNKYATIEVLGTTSLQSLEKRLPIDQTSKVTQIEIKVTSQQGESKIKLLDIERVSKDFSLDYVKVDTKSASLVENTQNQYIAYIYDNINEVTVDIGSKNSYAKVQQIIIDEETGDITVVREMTNKLIFDLNTVEQTTRIYFRIMAEDGITSSQVYTLDVEKMSTDVTLKEIYVNGNLIEKDENGKYKAKILDTEGNPTVKAITNHDLAHVRIALGEESLHIAEKQATLSSEKETIIPITVRSQSGITKPTYLYVEVISTSVNLDTLTVDNKEPIKYNEQTHTYEVIVAPDKEEFELFAMTESNYANIKYNNSDYGSSLRQLIQMDIGLQGKTITLTVTSESGQKADYTVELIRMSDSIELDYVKVDGIVRNPKKDTLNYEVMIGKKQEQAIVEIRTRYQYATIRLSDNTPVRNSETSTITCDLTQDKIIIPVVITAADGTTTETYNIVLVRGSNNTEVELTINDDTIEADGDGNYSITLPETIDNISIKALASIKGIMGAYSDIDLNNTGIFETPQKQINFTKEDYENLDKLQIPIIVVAEDGTRRENNITINLQKGTYITGKITTENVKGEYISTVTVYKTSDTRIIGDINNPRQEIAKVQTNKDGSFKILLYMTSNTFTDSNNNNIADELEEKYDIVVTKAGYLSYTVTDIELTEANETILDEYHLIAGDTVETGEIEIDDLVDLNDNFGVVITEFNKDTKSKFDLNEDGIVNSLDRNILKKNYSKKAETIKWINPKALINGAKGELEGSKEQINLQTSSYNVENANILLTTTQTSNRKSTDNLSNNSQTNETNNSNQEQKINYIKPMNCSYRISSDYGYRVHPVTGETKLHTGLDIVGIWHTEILSIADGEITYAGVQNGYGNCIEIKHIVKGVTIYSFYAHLSQINVQVGQKVKQGEIIGLEGGAETDPNHGTSTGHHLHFELRSASGSGHSLNPNDHIKF